MALGDPTLLLAKWIVMLDDSQYIFQQVDHAIPPAGMSRHPWQCWPYIVPIVVCVIDQFAVRTVGCYSFRNVGDTLLGLARVDKSLTRCALRTTGGRL